MMKFIPRDTNFVSYSFNLSTYVDVDDEFAV